MAKYRQMHTSFWQDNFVLDLTPEEKYFYIYLMTNQKTSQCGIYEISFKIMEAETGYNRETIQKLLDRFSGYGKVLQNPVARELMLLNWVRYNPPNSANVITCINRELKEVKTLEFVRTYLELCVQNEYNIEGLARGLEGATKGLGSNKIINNKEEIINNKQEVISKEDEEVPYEDIINYLNTVANTNYRCTSNKTRSLIKARCTEGYNIEQFKIVIDKKVAEWTGTEWEKFIRPETLFSNKFEGYLNQKVKAQRTDSKKGNFNNFDQRNYSDDFFKNLEAAHRGF